MATKDMFGDLHSIDIMAETKKGEVVLGLVCNGYIDGTPNTQTALLDKMEGYIRYTASSEFQNTYQNWPVILRIIFTEQPDPLILNLLNRCQSWVNEYGAALELEIGGQKMQVSDTPKEKWYGTNCMIKNFG